MCVSMCGCWLSAISLLAVRSALSYWGEFELRGGGEGRQQCRRSAALVSPYCFASCCFLGGVKINRDRQPSLVCSCQFGTCLLWKCLVYCCSATAAPRQKPSCMMLYVQTHESWEGEGKEKGGRLCECNS